MSEILVPRTAESDLFAKAAGLIGGICDQLYFAEVKGAVNVRNTEWLRQVSYNMKGHGRYFEIHGLDDSEIKSRVDEAVDELWEGKILISRPKPGLGVMEGHDRRRAFRVPPRVKRS